MRRTHVLSGGAPMPEQLAIEPLSSDPGFRVSGELDLLTAPQLRDALAIAGNHSRDIVLDFSAVTFVDSSGLRLLLAAAGAAQGRGANLVVRAPSPAVRRLFGITIPEGVPGLVVDLPEGLA
jgi:anti-sigma B factor antagonist